MSETSSSDCILTGFLSIKSQNSFNIKQNPKKVSFKRYLKYYFLLRSTFSFHELIECSYTLEFPVQLFSSSYLYFRNGL